METEHNKDKYDLIIRDYSLSKDEFKTLIKCFICRLNDELQCSFDFDNLSEVELFELFLEHKLMLLDIDKKKFVNSNYVGNIIATIFISLFTCIFANVFINNIGLLDKSPSDLGRIIEISTITFFIFLIPFVVIYIFYIRQFDKNNKNIIDIAKKYYDIELIYKVLKNKFKEQ